MSSGLKPLGMKLFVVSDGCTFAALLAALAILRTADPAWPGFPLASLGVAAVMAAVLLASSFAMARALAAMRQDNRAAAVARIGMAMGLGALFLALHVSEWRRLMTGDGITLRNTPSGSPLFGATFYTLTGLHMAHVAAGLLYLGVIGIGIRKGRYASEDVETGGIYWHFVDAVWLVLVAVLYVPVR